MTDQQWFTNMEARMSAAEREIAVFRAAIGFARWAGPLLVAIASVLVIALVHP